MKKILVTGASGILGHVLVRRFKNDVLGVSRSGRHDSRIADLSLPSEVRRVFDSHAFRLVIHSAAFSDVDGCERDPAMAYASNAESTRLLAEACSERGIPFIYVSTDYVFDGRKRTAYAETDAVGPVNVYGITKLAGEYFTKACKAPAAIVRTSWLFGPGNPVNFVNAIRSRVEKEPLVKVLDDQVDSPTYAEDLAEALEKIGTFLEAQGGRRAPAEIFQVCNAGQATRLQMALKIKECLGIKGVRIGRFDAKDLKGRVAIRPAHCVMSARRYEERFGAKLRPWEAALGEYLGQKAACGS